MDTQLLYEVGTICLGVILLLGWFSFSKVAWPEKYFGNSEIIAKTMSLKLRDYLVFRYLPVFTISFLFSLVLQKNARYPWFLAAYIGLIHSLFITIPAIYHNIIKRNDKVIILNKPILLVLHIFTILASTVSGLFASYLAQNKQLQLLTPSLEGIRDNIWAAAIVGFVVYAADRNFIRIERHPFEIKVEHSLHMLTRFHNYIIQISKQNNIDPRVFMSIAVLENINRPPWIRNAEKTLWKLNLIKVGTVGLMQVKSSRFMDDQESIDQAGTILGEIVKQVELEGLKLEISTGKYLTRVGVLYQGTEEYGKTLDEVFTSVRQDPIFKDYPTLMYG